MKTHLIVAVSHLNQWLYQHYNFKKCSCSSQKRGLGLEPPLNPPLTSWLTLTAFFGFPCFCISSELWQIPSSLASTTNRRRLYLPTTSLGASGKLSLGHSPCRRCFVSNRYQHACLRQGPHTSQIYCTCVQKSGVNKGVITWGRVILERTYILNVKLNEYLIVKLQTGVNFLLRQNIFWLVSGRGYSISHRRILRKQPI